MRYALSVFLSLCNRRKKEGDLGKKHKDGHVRDVEDHKGNTGLVDLRHFAAFS